jgi:hypothetical protein
MIFQRGVLAQVPVSQLIGTTARGANSTAFVS